MRLAALIRKGKTMNPPTDFKTKLEVEKEVFEGQETAGNGHLTQ